MASSNPKDLVKKLTAVKKVESTDDENIQEVQLLNRILLRRLKISTLAIVICFAATLIGVLVVGFNVSKTSNKTDMIDQEDKRFSEELDVFRSDDIVKTNASINKWETGGELQAILDTTNSELNSSKDFASLSSEAASMEAMITSVQTDLDNIDYADKKLGISKFYPDYHASFFGNGCPTKDNCPLSAIGNWSKVSNFDDCLRNCFESKDGTFTSASGVTYQSSTQGCWCTDKSQVASTFNTLAGYLYFKFI